MASTLTPRCRQLVGRGHCQGGIVAKLGVLKGRVHRALHRGRRRFEVCCRDIHGGRFSQNRCFPALTRRPISRPIAPLPTLRRPFGCFVGVPQVLIPHFILVAGRERGTHGVAHQAGSKQAQ